MTDTLETPASWETMTVAKPGPMMVVNPEREVSDAELRAVADGTGLNGPFVADLIASCATHERTGLNLFKMLAINTNNPAAKSRFEQFQDDAISAVATYDALAAALGVPVSYASPPARMTEAIDAKLMSAFLLSGSVDEMTLELKGIEAVLLASTMCIANTSLIRAIGDGLDEGSPARTAIDRAVSTLLPVQYEHLEWAAEMQRELVVTQAKSSMVQKAGAAAEAVVGKVRDVFGR